MLTENSPTINPNPVRLNAEDYAFLRQEGVNYIQSFAGNVWTDYNIHDPGITKLELLCYAITDLGYRTSFSISDMLTEPGKTTHEIQDVFYEPCEILPTHPITKLDYRKLILGEIKGVRNVWLATMDDEDYVVEYPIGNPTQPAYIYADSGNETLTFIQPQGPPPGRPLKLRGLYRVKIELEDDRILESKFGGYVSGTLGVAYTDPADFELKMPVIKRAYQLAIFELLAGKRNLCEDWGPINIVGKETVVICADIDIETDADAKLILEQIYNLVYNYISPLVPYYDLDTLVNEQLPTIDIFDGPTPDHAFIRNDELEKFDQRTVLYTSDLINLIMDIEGVIDIRKIHLSSYNVTHDIQGEHYNPIHEGEKYCLHLQDPLLNSFAFDLDIGLTGTAKKNKFNLYKKDFRITPVFDPVELAQLDFIKINEWPVPFTNKYPPITGKNRELDKYISIQNEFPKTYATGHEGISDTVSDLRKAQRLQLKAYLTFFDQVLADYLAQLSNVNDLLAWKSAQFNQSYYFLKLSADEIKDLDDLLRDQTPLYNHTGTNDYNGEYHKILESSDTREDRRSRLLDHLMARFNEVAVDYGLLKFLYNNGQGTVDFINDKIDFLKDYVTISRDRSHAFNYLENFVNFPDGPDDEDLRKNISGYEDRMFRILGLENCGWKFLEYPVIYPGTNLGDGIGGVQKDNGQYEFINQNSLNFDQRFGFHVIEHILLRPKMDDAYFQMVQQFAAGPWKVNPLLSACVNADMSGIDNQTCFCNDPYSFRITIAAAGWHDLSLDINFRMFFEKAMREEAPAHVALKICWLSPSQMYELECRYKLLMETLRDFEMARYQHYASAADEYYTMIYRAYLYTMALKWFMKIFNNLESIYPASYLQDCEEIEFGGPTGIASHPVILNRTALDNANPDYKFVPGYMDTSSGHTGYLHDHWYRNWIKT